MNPTVGKDYSSTSEQERFFLPINTKKQDVIFQQTVNVASKSGSDQTRWNKIVSKYKRQKNKKEFINSVNGEMHTTSYLVAWGVTPAMDAASKCHCRTNWSFSSLLER